METNFVIQQRERENSACDLERGHVGFLIEKDSKRQKFIALIDTGKTTEKKK